MPTRLNDISQRIGKLKGEVLAHAMPVEVLGITGMQKKMPKNVGESVVYRRWLPYGATASNQNTINRPAVNAAAHTLSEGVTPTADSLVPQDVTATLAQYGCLYAVTDKMVDLHEDDIPAEMKKQTGERLGLVREMIRYGALKAGTNAYYAGGTSRATVDKKLGLNILRIVTRNLRSNHAKMVTGILAPSPNFATKPVEAAWLVFSHSDLEADIRDIPGFIHVSAYGSRKPVHETEIGSAEGFRFCISPELAPYADAGAAVGSTGLFSTSGSNVDVYPVIVVGEDSWGQVALRGVNALDPTWIPPGQKDKSDPLGQRGYIGAKFYNSVVLLNQGWMAVIEAGISAIDNT
ncbi:MAG: N4-gp56 family major capsid protein [Vicinamibacterales bacterium]